VLHDVRVLHHPQDFNLFSRIGLLDPGPACDDRVAQAMAFCKCDGV
jgi:hypothetical protein